MKVRYLLDTNIWIYLRRRRPPEVVRRFAALSEGEAAMSVVTYAELRLGARKSQDPEAAFAKLDEIVMAFPVLTIGPDVGRIYADIRAALERSGMTIGGNDIWIAAHARSAGLTLVTNNVREFGRVPGLDVENWVQT